MTINRNLCLLISCLALLVFLDVWHTRSAVGMVGSADYLWEQKKSEGTRKSEFTQTYNLIMSRRLQPLYDASLKSEFKSVTGRETEDEERTQILPAVNLRLGHELMDLNLGWSEDRIHEDEISYTNERVYAGFGWRPKRLPNILCQFQGERKDESLEDEPELRDERISIKEDYTLKLGLLTLEHSLDQEKRVADGDVTTTYDILNKGKINQSFSFFDERLDIGTGYELSQEYDRNEDGSHNNLWKHNANLNTVGRPLEWMTPEYRFFWGDSQTTQDDNRETSIGHNLNLFLSYYPFMPSTFGMDYNSNNQRGETGRNEVTTYSLKMEPSIQDMFLDPDSSIYPVRTSFLVSNSTNESAGIRQNDTWSFLFTGSSTIYRGIDLDMDIGFLQRKGFYPETRRTEERVDGHLNLDLLPSMKASITQKTEWITDRGGGAEGRDFDGSLETRLVYRAVETFMLDVAYIIDYNGGRPAYEYSFNWRPASKLDFNMRYQSSTEDRESFFSGEMDIIFSTAIRLELTYQHPSDDQVMKLQFTVRF
ncbi:hypothetical protein JXL19_03645 [bacterium]|nr:hypothetical protein [bacterium]